MKSTTIQNAGDTSIQNGTHHRWSDTGDVPAVLAVCLIGAHHSTRLIAEDQEPPSTARSSSDELPD